MWWAYFIGLLLALTSSDVSAAQKVYPNGRRLPGKVAGFQFVDFMSPVNLSDPTTWVGFGPNTQINTATGAVQFVGGGGTTYGGFRIPFSSVPGTTYIVSYTTTASARVRAGPAVNSATDLNTQNSTTPGDYTFSFVASGTTTYLTFDKTGTTITRMTNITLYAQ